MKVLRILLFLAVVLGMSGCDSGSNSTFISPDLPPFRSFRQKKFDEALEEWTSQGVSDYSFDVVGYDCEPNIPFGTGTASNTGSIPSDTKFCAHVTVADGGIVSIENIDPCEMTGKGVFYYWELSFSPDEEIGAYTWGAIPDVFDKIRSISIEEESSPYAYDWYIQFALEHGGFPEKLSINIYSFDPDYSYDRPLLLRDILLCIVNFKVTENAPQ